VPVDNGPGTGGRGDTDLVEEELNVVVAVANIVGGKHFHLLKAVRAVWRDL
jgi:hypothetical protein